ncbi:MAG TPA: thioesterase family protein, partial [Gaiellaceae bacterium]|nr:thioesterase family protein [Gaiellaceae bacterium]
MEGFHYSTEVAVRFAETDAQGIAHHASFVVWLEVARVGWLSAFAGGYRRIQDAGIEALTTELRVRYHRAARFDDRLTVWARVVGVRGARFRYEYAVERGG